MNKVPMTVHGEQQLREELTRLKTVDRPNVIKDIAEARAHGDLKENAEYHAAREQQSFIEGRIADIESRLANAQVIDITKMTLSDTVVFGCSVTLLNIETEVEATYQIVGDDEANIKISKISINSPIARAVIGKHLGDEVKVNTPTGTVLYEIADVTYASI